MLYSNKAREDLQKLNKLVSLKNQVKVVGVQDRLDKQNFHEDIRKVFEPLSNLLKMFLKKKQKL